MADFNFPPIVGLNSNLLVDLFAARSLQSLARNPAAQNTAPAQKPDTSVPPPWDPGAKPLGQEEIVNKTLASGVFFENDLGAFSDSAAPPDQKKLFALYAGVNRLAALGSDAADKTTTDARRRFLNKRFAEGLAQLDSFLDATQYDELGFVKGVKRSQADSALAIDRGSTDFVGGVIQDGPFDDPVASFAGDVRFTITAKKVDGDVVVNLDLADLGTTPRTLDNVANYINGKLSAAGLASRINRVKIGTPDKNGIIQGSQFGYKITGFSTEPLSFSAPLSAPALYSVGTSGSGNAQALQLIRYDANSGAAASVNFAKRIEAGEGVKNTALATATGSNGEVYVLSQSAGETGGLTPRGAQDVFLNKYDSTGNLVYTRGLGASDTASGLALDVAADGSVTVAGKITGGLGTTTDFGGSDGFAVKYDATGREVFVHRFGGANDEAVTAVASAADGTIYLAGRTKSGLGGAQGGGNDGFVRAIASDGTVLYTRQFGGAGEENATGIAVDGNGDLLVTSVEDGNGFLRKYSAADGTSPALYQSALGALDGGTLSAIAFDGTGIILGGSAGAAHGLGAGLNAHAGGLDGFITRIDEDAGGQPVRTYTSFLGTGGADRIASLAVDNGVIYAAGDTVGDLPGGGTINGTENAFLATFDGASGALSGTVEVSGRGGFSSAAGLAIDPAGASVLDAFGLPHGDILYADSLVITDRSVAREGDNFLISVDGGPKRRVRIDTNDNYRSLTFKINVITLGSGKGEVVRNGNKDTLRIQPAEGHTIELFAGNAGRDLLSALGLPEGLVANEPLADNAQTASAAPPIYGLGLSSTLDLSNQVSAASASDVLQQALTTIRDAYRTLTIDPALQALLDGKGAGGPVPAYLSAQIANYSAGLARLQSGSGGGSFF